MLAPDLKPKELLHPTLPPHAVLHNGRFGGTSSPVDHNLINVSNIFCIYTNDGLVFTGFSNHSNELIRDRHSSDEAWQNLYDYYGIKQSDVIIMYPGMEIPE